MFVELIDQLRCPAPHEDAWLVLFADESRERHIIRGTLGCPICGRRFAIEDGTAWFVAETSWTIGVSIPASVPRAPTADLPTPGALPPTALAAFLGLAEPGGTAGLFGRWAECAEELGDIVEQVELVAIAPDMPTHPMQSAIVPPSAAQIPLAAGSLRAAAIDVREDAGIVVMEAARLVRRGGRIVAPASVPVPAGVRELTRNHEWWIGKRDGGTISGIIPLSRSRSR